MRDLDWPDKPRHRAQPKCDRCGAPGHDPLCPGCEDREYWDAKMRAEERDNQGETA